MGIFSYLRSRFQTKINESMVTYHRVQVEDCKGQSVRTVLSELAIERFGINAVVLAVSQGHHYGHILTAQAGTTEHLAGILPMG